MQLQALDRKLPVNLRNDNITVGRLFCPVDHHDVAVIQPQLLHAAAARPHEECGGAPADAELVQVKLGLDIVLSRGGESCSAGVCKQRHTEARREDGGPEQHQAGALDCGLHRTLPAADVGVSAVCKSCIKFSSNNTVYAYSIIEQNLSGKSKPGRSARKQNYVAERREKIFSAGCILIIYADSGPGMRTDAFSGCKSAAWLSAAGLLYLC